jgi:hypothetical protein
MMHRGGRAVHCLLRAAAAGSMHLLLHQWLWRLQLHVLALSSLKGMSLKGTGSPSPSSLCYHLTV